MFYLELITVYFLINWKMSGAEALPIDYRWLSGAEALTIDSQLTS
jgi:hypothetical protein